MPLANLLQRGAENLYMYASFVSTDKAVDYAATDGSSYDEGCGVGVNDGGRGECNVSRIRLLQHEATSCCKTRRTQGRKCYHSTMTQHDIKAAGTEFR
jgi:hypothetical protein